MSNFIQKLVAIVAIVSVYNTLAVPYVIIKNNLQYKVTTVTNPATGRIESKGDTGVITIDLDVNMGLGGLSGFNDKKGKKLDPQHTKEWNLKGTVVKSITIARTTEDGRGRKITQKITIKGSDLQFDQRSGVGARLVNLKYFFLVDNDGVTISGSNAQMGTALGHFDWADPDTLKKGDQGKIFTFSDK